MEGTNPTAYPNLAARAPDSCSVMLIGTSIDFSKLTFGPVSRLKDLQIFQIGQLDAATFQDNESVISILQN